MSIITLEEYKTLAGIADETKDAQISAFIEIVEADFLKIRNRPFDTKIIVIEEVDEVNGVTNTYEQVVNDYPIGSKAVAFDMLTFRLSKDGKNGKTSETIGNYSYSMQSLAMGYPEAIYAGIDKYATSNVEVVEDDI